MQCTTYEAVFSNIGGHFTFENISGPCQIPRQLKDVQGAGEAQGRSSSGYTKYGLGLSCTWLDWARRAAL